MFLPDCFPEFAKDGFVLLRRIVILDRGHAALRLFGQLELNTERAINEPEERELERKAVFRS